MSNKAATIFFQVKMKPNKYVFFRVIPFMLFIIGISGQAQFSSVTETSISNNNLRIDLTFDEEIFSVAGCSTPTCIEITDFNVTLSGGNATLASNTPITITKLGNFDFIPQWNTYDSTQPAGANREPNNSGGNEDWAQHEASGQLNDFSETNSLNGVLEIIEPIARVIPGYNYITSYPSDGSACAHSYYRSTTASGWLAQKLKAQNAGGDLLVYNSPEEFSHMIPAFNANGPTGVGNTWIGLSQDRTAADYEERVQVGGVWPFPITNGGWYWDDGTPMDNSAAKLKYQITIALNGVADGDELISVNPVTGPASIFNCAGVAAINQVNGANQVYLNDKLDPYIVSSSISDDNTTVRVVFNETIFTDAASNPMLNTDFELFLVQNGSVASLSSINPSSIINYGNRIFDLTLPLIGLPMSGREVLTILPALGSVFDAASNTASSVQANNTVNFNPPKTGPIYLSNIYKTSTVSGTLVVASETFLCDDITFNNYNQAYHDGVLLEPQVGNYLIYNKNYSYPSVMIQGSDFGYFHLRGFDRILEVQKSDGLIVAKYSCL